MLSGGGSLGAVQVGMLQALADRSITPDLLVGASAWALNAAFVAGHGFDEATEVVSGTEVLLSTGEPTAAVLASAAIPAAFPPVPIDGRVLFDGGIANNTPISHAVALGADRVIVLPAGTACALTHPPRSAIATAVHALTLLIEQRLVLDVAAYHEQVELIVLPPLCPLTESSTDFRAAARLIARAWATTTRWLGATGIAARVPRAAAGGSAGARCACNHRPMLFLYRPRQTWMPFARPLTRTDQAAYNRQLQETFESTRRVAPAVPASAQRDPIADLKALAALRDDGVLTDAEVEVAKARVLSA